MSEFVKFLDGIIEERVSEIHTCMPARVVKFDEATGKVDVQPLFNRKLKNGNTVPYPMLVGLPVLKRKTKPGLEPITDIPFYEKGDIVLVAFAERALDGVGARKHDLSDGIVIGLLG